MLSKHLMEKEKTLDINKTELSFFYTGCYKQKVHSHYDSPIDFS